MRYTDSKNNITFNSVKPAGALHASGPIGHNGMYTVDGSTITSITKGISLINGIDIDWNGAQVEPGVIINTTGDLLNWIRNKSENGSGGSGQFEADFTIDNEGYLLYNGNRIGKVKGNDGSTPTIGANGNWFINGTDTGVKASGKDAIEQNVNYVPAINSNTTGSYRIGALKVGDRTYEMYGVDTTGEGGGVTQQNVINLIEEKVTVTPSLTSGTQIATIKVGNTSKILYAPNNSGSSGVTLNQPLSSINNLNSNPTNNKSMLIYNNNNWGYTKVTDVAEDIKNYYVEHNYFNGGGNGDSVSISNLNNTGSRIATITINNTPYDIKAPTSGDPVVSGDTVGVTAEYQSGNGNKKLATISVNNSPTEIYMPAISKQDIPDFPDIPSAYDDTAIQTSLTNLNNTLSTLRTQFENLHKWTQTEIEGLINGALSDWDWISELDPDSIFNLSGWNDKLKEYIQQVIKTDADGQGATWSSLIQRFDSLDATINRLEAEIAAGGQEIDYEYLASLIHIGIEDIDGLSTAITKLESVYSWFETAEGDVNTLKTNMSGLTTRVSSIESSLSGYATSISTLEGEVGTLESQSALLLSSKTDLENRMASAEASLATKATLNDVSSGISEAISGLYTKSEVDGLIASATTNIVTQATMQDYVTGQIGTATSGLATTAYVDETVSSATTGLISQSTMENYVTGQIQTATAGFVASTDVYTKTQTDGLIASAKSEMSSEIDGVRALISAGVTKTDNGDGTYSIDSDIIISADQIELDGNTIFSLLSAAKTDDPLGRWYKHSELSPGYINLHETSGNSDLEQLSISTDTIDIINNVNQTETYISSDFISLGIGGSRKNELIGIISAGTNDSGTFDIEAKDNNNNSSKISIDPETGIYLHGSTWIVSDNGSNVEISASDVNSGDLAINGGLSVSGNLLVTDDLTVNGKISNTDIELTPDGTNGTFLAPYGLYSVYNKYYSGSWGGEQQHIKLSVQTGSSDNSTVECAVHNIQLLGEAVKIGDVSSSSLIEFRGNSTPVEFKSPSGFDFNNNVTISGDISATGTGTFSSINFNNSSASISYYNNRVKIDDNVNIEGDLLLSNSLKLYNNLNEEQVSIELDNNEDLSFINKSGNNSMAVSFNTFETLYASTIECDEVIDGTSDERTKENITPVEVSISDIANARIVNFNFIGKKETKFGSIAQDWQNIFPNTVKENSKGNLTMDYKAIALGAAVIDAREIVALKEENRQLKERLAAIEQKLEAINNALG